MHNTGFILVVVWDFLYDDNANDNSDGGNVTIIINNNNSMLCFSCIPACVW